MQAIQERQRRPSILSRAAVPARRASYGSVWKIWLPIPILLLVLDITFNAWFWRIPHITGRADFGYQFLIDLQRAETPKPPGSIRVLAFGSSVSGSFDPYQVEGLVGAASPGVPVDVHRLLKPGIKPGDYRVLFEAEGSRVQPDIVVITFNLLDFLNPGFERSFRAAVREALPPRAVLRTHANALSIGDKLDLFVASLSNLYRYRKEIHAALSAHVHELGRWLRARRVHGSYGLYADGYTQQRFGVKLPPEGAAELEYYVDPAWIQQRGRVSLRFEVDGGVTQHRVETDAGWKRVALDAHAGALVHVSADSAWSPRVAAGTHDPRLLGVRLRGVPAEEGLNGSRAPYRYPPHSEGEIDSFLRMGTDFGAGFENRWNEALNSETPFGARFRAYRDSKLRVRDQPFAATGEYVEMEGLVAYFAAAGATVILVNTPESPWILEHYRDTPYYRGYLDFFRGLAATYPDVQFHDLSSLLPPEDFNDWHHVNFVGGIKLGRVYADLVSNVLGRVQERRGQGA
jgi:hypothetical protein